MIKYKRDLLGWVHVRKLITFLHSIKATPKWHAVSQILYFQTCMCYFKCMHMLKLTSTVSGIIISHLVTILCMFNLSSKVLISAASHFHF